jgi:D-hexose-6-phosphate mutarotase
LTSPAGTAQLCLLGAHLTHFQPKGQPPVLWTSEKSLFEPGKAIRSGVPVILPWFAKPADNADARGSWANRWADNRPLVGKPADNFDAPQHGAVRTVEWNLTDSRQSASMVGVALSLSANETTRNWFAHDFEARLSVTLTNALDITLQVRNTSAEPWSFEEALHTYFAVSDIRKVHVDGLSGASYWSRVEGVSNFQQDGPVTFAKETDRVYMNTTSACTIHDPGLNRNIVIEKVNSASTVVWNPWIEKSKVMGDFGADEWTGMLCVETCNIRDNMITLPAGKTHKMKAILRSLAI